MKPLTNEALERMLKPVPVTNEEFVELEKNFNKVYDYVKDTASDPFLQVMLLLETARQKTTPVRAQLELLATFMRETMTPRELELLAAFASISLYAKTAEADEAKTHKRN